MKINNSDPIFTDNQEEPLKNELPETAQDEKLSEVAAKIVSEEAFATVSNPTKEILRQIALQFDLNVENNITLAVQQSAEYLVKSRLSKKLKNQIKTEKIVKDLGAFISDDPFLRATLLKILQNLKHNSQENS